MDAADREQILAQIMDTIEGYIGTQTATYVDYQTAIEEVLCEVMPARCHCAMCR